MVILFVALLGAGAFLLVKNGVFGSKTDPYNFVPSNGIFVLETKEPVAFWNQLVTQPLWERISDIPLIRNLERQLTHLDSLTGKSGNLDKALKQHQFLVSLHPTGRDEFDFLFTVSSSDERMSGFVRNLESHIQNQTEVRRRNYSGITLYEYSPSLASGTLTYGFFEDVFLASFTSFLVEDAIRTAKSGEMLDFKGTYPKLFSAEQAGSNLGLFRLGSRGFAALIGGMTNAQGKELARDIEQLGLAVNLAFGFDENTVSFYGELETEDGMKFSPTTRANAFGRNFFDYVSSRTAVLRIVDQERIQAVIPEGTRMDRTKNTILADVDDQIVKHGFFEMIDREVAYMVFEQFNVNHLDKLLLVPAKDVTGALSLLENFALEINQGNRELVGREYHRSQQIVALDVEELPLHLFRGSFEGFQRTYVSNVGNYLVFSNSVRVLKSYLDDLYNDHTWGKSITKKFVKDSFEGDAAFYQWVDFAKFYDVLLASTTPAWNSMFQKYAPQLKAINTITLEAGNGKNALNVEIRYQLEPISPSTDIILTLSNSTTFRDPLIFGPKALQNFNDRSLEYLVQDKDLEIHLVSATGDRVFSQPLQTPILSDVFQIDYYKNDKLQLVFACEDGIYAFDRLGNLLPGFPVRLADGRKVSFFNLVDYDKSRDYRFYVSDDFGDLYIFDQQGNLLEGWNPRRTTGRLATAPSHLRIAGIGDVMVSLHENGNLEILNRRGESRIGPPVRVGDAVFTSYGLTERGGSASQLVTINASGEVVAVNFKGELTYRNQLHRPDRETKFHVINNQNQDEFLIVLHEFNKVTVLNANESPLFEYPILSDELDFQWFSFGHERNVFVIIDKVQEFIYLFNLKGQLLNSRPLEGKDKISVTFAGSKNEYRIAHFYQNILKEYKLPL